MSRSAAPAALISVRNEPVIPDEMRLPCCCTRRNEAVLKLGCLDTSPPVRNFDSSAGLHFLAGLVATRQALSIALSVYHNTGALTWEVRRVSADNVISSDIKKVGNADD